MKQRSCSFQNTSSSKPTVVPEIPIQEAATPPAWLLPTQPKNCHVQQRLESGVRGTRLGPGRLPLPSSPAPVPWPWAAPHSPDPTGRGGGAGHRRPGRRRLPRLNAGASRCLRDPQHAEGVEQGVNRAPAQAFTHQPSPLGGDSGRTSSPSAIAVDVHVTLPKSGPGAQTDSETQCRKRSSQVRDLSFS